MFRLNLNLNENSSGEMCDKDIERWLIEKGIGSVIKSDLQCLYFRADNSVPSLRILIYLISRKINFYISSRIHIDKFIPPFCDFILESLASGDHNKLKNEFSISENLNFKISPFIAPQSGCIFLNSSGSTGEPKNIFYRSEKLLQNAARIASHFQLKKRSRILVPVPISHMYGLGVGVLPGLIAGAEIKLIERSNVLKLYEQLRTFQPDVTLLTPSVIQMMLSFKKRLNYGVFISAGDFLRKDHAEEFGNIFGSLFNIYGCSEMGAIGISDMLNHERITPFDGVELQINNGLKGDLFCRREDCFEGYVDNFGFPVNNISNGWFSTNDLGGKVGENTFEIYGRVNDTINRLGFLLSYKEIESKLQQAFTAFENVMVLKGPGHHLEGSELVAIFAYGKNKFTKEDADQIARRCQTEIPNYFKPDRFFFIPEFPKLSNGKIDKQNITKRLMSYEQLKGNGERRILIEN